MYSKKQSESHCPNDDRAPRKGGWHHKQNVQYNHKNNKRNEFKIDLDENESQSSIDTRTDKKAKKLKNRKRNSKKPSSLYLTDSTVIKDKLKEIASLKERIDSLKQLITKRSSSEVPEVESLDSILERKFKKVSSSCLSFLHCRNKVEQQADTCELNGHASWSNECSETNKTQRKLKQKLDNIKFSSELLESESMPMEMEQLVINNNDIDETDVEIETSTYMYDDSYRIDKSYKHRKPSESRSSINVSEINKNKMNQLSVYLKKIRKYKELKKHSNEHQLPGIIKKESKYKEKLERIIREEIGNKNMNEDPKTNKLQHEKSVNYLKDNKRPKNESVEINNAKKMLLKLSQNSKIVKKEPTKKIETKTHKKYCFINNTTTNVPNTNKSNDKINDLSSDMDESDFVPKLTKSKRHNEEEKDPNSTKDGPHRITNNNTIVLPESYNSAQQTKGSDNYITNLNGKLEKQATEIQYIKNTLHQCIDLLKEGKKPKCFNTNNNPYNVKIDDFIHLNSPNPYQKFFKPSTSDQMDSNYKCNAKRSSSHKKYSNHSSPHGLKQLKQYYDAEETSLTDLYIPELKIEDMQVVNVQNRQKSVKIHAKDSHGYRADSDTAFPNRPKSSCWLFRYIKRVWCF